MSSIFFLHDVFHFFFYTLKNSFATLLVLFSRWQQQSNCTRKYWAPLIRISRHSLHTDSNNRTVSVSTRVARNASFVQLQNCLITMPSYIFLRCQRQYALLGFVIRNAFSRNCKIFSLRWHCISLRCQRQHSYFGQFRCVPYRYLFLSKILTWPLFTLEKLCGFTQPAINLGSMLKHQMSVWAMPEWYFVLSCCIRPRDDAKWYWDHASENYVE